MLRFVAAAVMAVVALAGGAVVSGHGGASTPGQVLAKKA